MPATRRTRLRARLAEAGLDALYVTKLVNVRYLTGFTGSVATLLVTTSDAVLAVDGRYAEQAAAEAPDLHLVVTRGDAWLDEHVPAGRLGVESHDLPWDRVRALDARTRATIVPAPSAVESLRQRKDPAELDHIRRACAITDQTFADVCTWLAPGLSERQVAHRLHHTLTTLGADDRAFEAIVAAGPNSARPHHRPTDRLLAAGDLVKLDFGALVAGYHADMTRMVALGDPGEKLRRVFDLVREAQRAGVSAVADGSGAATVDAACREPITAAGHGDHFPHGSGHGLGLEIHEEPILRTGADATLRSRMVVTVEPGVYLPGLGGVRIEDTVTITAEGADVLTRTPKDLVCL